METVTIRGVEVPKLGLGTARLTGEECREVVETALELGYRHVDTAQLYGNEEAVGDAIARSAVDREEVFLTTKIHWDHAAADDVHSSFADSLDRLGVDSVDLLLIHSTNDDVPIEETIGAMNRLQEEGTVEHIGVSNYSVEETKTAVEASSTPVLTNQVEYHVDHGQADLLEWCVEHDVLLTAYSPLDEGSLASDPELEAIAERHDATAAQVALAWLAEQPNVMTIPKASSEARLTENLSAIDVELTADERDRLFERSGGVPSLRSK